MDQSKPAVDRRALLGIASGTLLVAALAGRQLWARERPDVIKAWAKGVVAAKDELRAGTIDVLGWQAAIERLNATVPVNELAAYLDLDRLTAGFAYDSPLAETADPLLPADIIGAAGMKRWFVRVFGLRKGGVVIPHVHNNMVSAHLVVDGRFHARTHDRLRDLDNAVLLRPTRDGTLRKGETITMSDRHHNQHWLIAETERAMTLDVGIVAVPASWEYGLKANDYNMIYVDPTVAQERDGSIAAPILSWEAAQAKFAG
ncbi:hypothetical protein [Novosphingobium sp. B 225]|uniref:hypothetical protein n=1 Tax=Novosphingobium sp. B 225 TaxID=1961849 RepID=UPI000B4A77B7|nr:hypothetical protein [Novosphingobium sp. B 225]